MIWRSSNNKDGLTTWVFAQAVRCWKGDTHTHTNSLILTIRSNCIHLWRSGTNNFDSIYYWGFYMFNSYTSSYSSYIAPIISNVPIWELNGINFTSVPTSKSLSFRSSTGSAAVGTPAVATSDTLGSWKVNCRVSQVSLSNKNPASLPRL